MILLAMIWMAFIFVATCTRDVSAFLHEFKISFTYQSSPAWREFKFLYPIEQISRFEMIGHFFLFFILMLLLASAVKWSVSVVIAVTYAIFTEYLQMHFGRGAELYDIAANVLGIMAALSMVGIFHLVIRNEKVKYKRSA